MTRDNRGSLMPKKLLCAVLCICFGAAVFAVPAAAYTPSGFTVQSDIVYFADSETGDLLYEKNSGKKAYPSALTNIMTAVIICESIKDLHAEQVTVPEDAYSMMLGTGASTAGLKPGEHLTAEDLLYAVMLNAAPDAAITAAYHIAGDIPSFVRLMNEKAESLGMNHTNYCTVTGLHSAEQYTTAEDMFLLASYAMQIPAIKEAAGSRRYTVPATDKNDQRTLSTTNALIDSTTAYYYRYATGLKTGYTDEAGRCLAAAAQYGGNSYILILLHAPNDEGARVEFKDAANLFRWAFNEFDYQTVLTKDTLVGEAAVDLAWDEDHVSLYPQNDVSALIPKDADLSTVTVNFSFDAAEHIDAPVKKGQVIGTGKVMYADQTLCEINIVAGESVKRNGYLWFARGFRKVVNSTAFRIAVLLILLAIGGFILFVAMINRKKRRRRVFHRK